jgi:hypothetical protein
MGQLLRIGTAATAALMLLAPAIWNRFPLLQYDTGGYLARWFEGYLVPSRSTVYGLFLLIFSRPDFWPAVIAQSLLTVWVLMLLLRALGFGGRPLLLLAITALLCVFTTLPWLASILLTDIFAGLAVIALYLLIFADDTLGRFERIALIALVAFAAATHSATFAVTAGLVLVATLAWPVFAIGSGRGIARSAAAVALGALMLLSANFITSGRFVWTPGGIALSFGRMLQDGIVTRYLDEHCPNAKLRLCAHRDELPTDADEFFWGNSVFDRLGRFAGLGDEMGAIVKGSLRAYPAWQAQMAAAAVLRQLVRVASGEGVVNTIWHTYAIIEKFTPQAVPAMRAARQQHGEIGFDALNDVHIPVALAAMLLLIPIMGYGFRSREREDSGFGSAAFADLGRLAATTALSLLGNAVVCGVFANPHDRYGARLVWVAPLVVLLTFYRVYELRRDATAAQPAA